MDLIDEKCIEIGKREVGCREERVNEMGYNVGFEYGEDFRGVLKKEVG